VPAVVGQPEEDARTAIEDLDLKFVRHQEPSTEFDKGQVTRTNPEEGTPVEARSDVDVWISTGPDAITVPPMRNFTQDQARVALTGAGFDLQNVTWTTKNDPEVVKDAVVDTDPPEGTDMLPADPITVYLSSGLVELGSLVTLTEKAATDALGALRLPPKITPEESDEPVGTVIRQNPPPGLVPQGTTVEIVVAIARAPEMVRIPPNLKNMTCQAALDALGALGLNGTCVYADGIPVPEAELGTATIESSDPAGGTDVVVPSSVALLAKP